MKRKRGKNNNLSIRYTHGDSETSDVYIYNIGVALAFAYIQLPKETDKGNLMKMFM